jgi:hypothetical protein
MSRMQTLLLILSLFSLITFSVSCKKDNGDSYTIQGYVIDQVTRKPVGNATICIGFLPFCDGLDEYLFSYGNTVNSEPNGSFILKVDKLLIDDPDHRCSYIFSKMYGYIGSSYFPAPQGGVLTDTIELYHPATLNIHVMNDTISNNIDEVQVRLAGVSFRNYPKFVGTVDLMGRPTIMKICKGRNFDTTFVFTNVWGNLKYYVTAGADYSYYSSPNQVYSVKLIPDSTSEILIKF